MDDYRTTSLQGWSAVAPDWAELIDRIDRQLAPAADWIMSELALQPGERVLELAGGPGTISMAAARAVGPGGQVIYSDFAEAMVDVARERLSASGLGQVECRVIDAESIDLADGSVDAIGCRMGYMLMADPAAALRESARVLAPGGRLALAVWSDASANPWVAVPMQVVMRYFDAPPPPPDAPGIFALADETRLSAMLQAAGLQSIRMETIDDAVKYESFDQFLDVNQRLAGPLKALLADLDDDGRWAVEAGMREAAEPYREADGSISMSDRMVVASAHRS